MESLTTGARAACCWCLLAALAGCATSRSGAAFAEKHAWVGGYVSAIARADELSDRETSDCPFRGASGEPAATSFAVISYVSPRGAPHRRVVALNDDSPLRRGDWVWLDLDHCTAPLPRLDPAWQHPSEN